MARNVKHGHRGGTDYSRSKTYNSWRAMIMRCTQASHEAFHHYGGRGIRVCDEWKVFNKFLEDMGQRPHNKTLDRIDVNGIYCKENCRWATKKVQALNRR